MRIVFAGTSEIARTVLRALIDHQMPPVAVYTRADRPTGRGLRLTQSPVKQLVRQRLTDDCPLEQPENLHDQESLTQWAAYEPDLIVTAEYGLLLPVQALAAARLAPINVHPSMLPRWRGASPITYALAEGDRHTGVSLARMERSLDTGNIVRQCRLEIAPNEDNGALSQRLAQLAGQMVVALVDQLRSATTDECRQLLAGQAQDERQVSWAPKITKQQTYIDWTNPAECIVNWVRAVHPRPAARTVIDGQVVIVHRAHVDHCASETEQALSCGQICPDDQRLRLRCRDGVVQVDELQLSGRRSMTCAAFICGHPLARWHHLIAERPQSSTHRSGGAGNDRT